MYGQNVQYKMTHKKKTWISPLSTSPHLIPEYAPEPRTGLMLAAEAGLSDLAREFIHQAGTQDGGIIK